MILFVILWTFIYLATLGGAVIEGRWDIIPRILLSYVLLPALFVVGVTLFVIVFIVVLLIGSVSLLVSGEVRKEAFKKFPR